MKKSIILTIAAAVICALAFSISCNNLEEVTEPDPEPETPGEIILHATVADPGGDDSGTNSDSKAYFSNKNWVWEGRDIISVWYDKNTGNTPDALMGYDATKKAWAFTKYPSGNSPSSSGTLKAVYSVNGVTITTTSNYTYTYISSDQKYHLYCDLKNWKYLSEIRIVMDLDGNASDYTLACDRFYPITGYSVGSSSITATKGTKGASVQGISNKDGGVAFVFATAEYSSSKVSHNFTLKSTSDHYVKTGQMSKSLEQYTNCSKIKSIHLKNCTWTLKIAGTADDGRSWVQLWDNGPLWANFNVGSTINSYENQTSYSTDVVGGLYKWCGTQNYRDGEQTDSYKTSYSLSNDTARKVWGGSWRMPTKAEFDKLFYDCTWTWCSKNYESGCKIKGYKVSGKGDYANNSIFLPAAGYWGYSYKKVFSTGDIGMYWAASIQYNSSQAAYQAYHLYYWKSYDHMELKYLIGLNNSFFSVRPVMD